MTNVWTDDDSAKLTAKLLVVDGVRMDGNRLDEDEIVAALLLARDLRILRAVIADRMGWSVNRLWKWASARGIAFHEKEYEPLSWCTRQFERDHPVGDQTNRRPVIRGRGRK